MTQFLRDQASDSEEVDTPLMLDGTYLSRNFATLGPLPDSRRVVSLLCFSLVSLFQELAAVVFNSLLRDFTAQAILSSSGSSWLIDYWLCRQTGRDTSSFLVWITLGLSWVLPLVLGLGAWVFSLHLQAIVWSPRLELRWERGVNRIMSSQGPSLRNGKRNHENKAVSRS